LDLPSALIGLIVGAGIIFFGFRMIQYYELQAVPEEFTKEAELVSDTIKLDFYDVLKRDDLYPPAFDTSSK